MKNNSLVAAASARARCAFKWAILYFLERAVREHLGSAQALAHFKVQIISECVMGMLYLREDT